MADAETGRPRMAELGRAELGRVGARGLGGSTFCSAARLAGSFDDGERGASGAVVSPGVM